MTRNPVGRGALAAAAAAAALTAAGLTPPAAAQDEVIRIGLLRQVHDAANFAIAKELGESYDLEFIPFLRYADAEIALSQGDIQMSSLGYASAIGAAARGGDPRFAFVVGMSRGAINLVCREDVTVEDWPDIAGKTMGVLTGGPAEIFFDDALVTHGLQPSDVTKVSFTAPGPPLLQALENETIECMAVYEPFAATAVADGYGYYPPVDLAENSFLGINGGLAVNGEFLEANPDFVRAAVEVAVEAAQTYPQDPATWIADTVQNTGFEPEVVAVGINHVILDWKMYQSRALVLAEAMQALGLVREVPSDEAIAGYFDYRFLEAATGLPAAELGRDE